MPEPIIHRHLTRIELGAPHTFYLDAEGATEAPLVVKMMHVRGNAPGSKDVEWSDPPEVRLTGGFLAITATPTEVRPPSGHFSPFGGIGDGLVMLTIIHPPEAHGGTPRPQAENPVIPVYYGC